MTKKNKNFSNDDAKDAIGPSERISRAAEGLIYISETDSEIAPFVWGRAESVSIESVTAMAESTGERRFEEVSAADFFARLTGIRDWYGDRDKERAAKFGDLYASLTSDLTDLKVFRIGTIQIDIYVVGMDADGRLAGVSMRAVET